MSLTGVLRTGVSGMNAQTNRISTVAENIQNASTTGYKRTSTEFSSLLLESSGVGNYNSGAVETVIRRSISEEGPTSFTTSDTDLAINGKGFFLVRDGSGGQFLTRAGNFVKDGTTGNLVNAAGFTLLGYALNPDGTLATTSGSTDSGADTGQLQANPSSTMTLQGNLKASSEEVTTPSATSFTTKTPVTTYDNLGNKITLDVVFSKTATASTWSVSVYTQDATPILVGNANTITFGPTGQITGTSKFTLPADGDRPELALDLSTMTQLAAANNPKGSADGSTPTKSISATAGSGSPILTEIKSGATQLQARPSSTMTLQGNLKASSEEVTTPSATSFTTKTPVTTYDNLGNKITLDVVFSKTATADTWSVSVYTQDATPILVGSESTIAFGPTGQVTGTSKFTLPADGSRPALTLDLGAMTQLAPDSSPKGVADGSAPTSSTGVAFGDDGTVYTIYADGTRAATYKLLIADVSSPDQLQPKAGNVFEATSASGNIELGFAKQNGLGTLKSKALEQSNVDVATELTTMIESQSVYTANSKVFMTGNEMLETLMNLKR